MEKKLVARKVFYNPIYRDKVTVLKSASETGGLYSLGELEVSSGGGNSMHVHSAFEETFTARVYQQKKDLKRSFLSLLLKLPL
jgi:hypothetical protein